MKVFSYSSSECTLLVYYSFILFYFSNIETQAFFLSFKTANFLSTLNSSFKPEFSLRDSSFFFVFSVLVALKACLSSLIEC